MTPLKAVTTAIEPQRAAGSSAMKAPRRELVTLAAYLETGSHKGAAWRLGISESTSRQRVSQLMRRVGARNAAQAVWLLHNAIAAEKIQERASEGSTTRLGHSARASGDPPVRAVRCGG